MSWRINLPKVSNSSSRGHHSCFSSLLTCAFLPSWIENAVEKAGLVFYFFFLLFCFVFLVNSVSKLGRVVLAFAHVLKKNPAPFSLSYG